MTETIGELFLLALAVSAASMTVSQTAAFRPVRLCAAYWTPLGKLLRCPYCLSHWLALAAVAFYRPSWWLPVEVFAVVGLASIFSLASWEFLGKVDK
jgi:hypothetical protein